MQFTFRINGETRSLEADPDLPLLWALRDFLGLKGAKYGCGIAACGACTVQVNGRALRACVVPLRAVAGAEIRTIEGLGGETRCSRPGSRSRCRSAATARPGRSCRR